MPKKETPKSLLTKHLGKDVANALLVKIDKMIKKGESAAKIEKAAQDEIDNYIGMLIEEAVKAAVGPKEFKKLPPALTVSLHKSIRTKISAHNKISPAISKMIGTRP